MNPNYTTTVIIKVGYYSKTTERKGVVVLFSYKFLFTRIYLNAILIDLKDCRETKKKKASKKRI